MLWMLGFHAWMIYCIHKPRLGDPNGLSFSGSSWFLLFLFVRVSSWFGGSLSCLTFKVHSNSRLGILTRTRSSVSSYMYGSCKYIEVPFKRGRGPENLDADAAENWLHVGFGRGQCALSDATACAAHSLSSVTSVRRMQVVIAQSLQRQSSGTIRKLLAEAEPKSSVIVLKRLWDETSTRLQVSLDKLRLIWVMRWPPSPSSSSSAAVMVKGVCTRASQCKRFSNPGFYAGVATRRRAANSYIQRGSRPRRVPTPSGMR